MSPGRSAMPAGAKLPSGSMIVALARKLLIALWRLVTTGEIPEGVELRPAVFQPGPEALRHSRDLVASPPQSGSGAVWIDVARSLGYASGREASIWINDRGAGAQAADSAVAPGHDRRDTGGCRVATGGVPAGTGSSAAFA